MKILFIVIFATSFTMSSLAWASSDDNGKHHQGDVVTEIKTMESGDGKPCENVVNVGVNGLVCDFCARALEKVFGKREEVTGIDVDLDNAMVSISMKDGMSIDDDTLTKLITDSGYSVIGINNGCQS